MATFIFLDSTWRDREQYPNPAEFTVTGSQIKNWFPNARTVRAFPQDVSQKQLEMVTTIKLLHLVVPYQENIIDTPVLLVDVHSEKYKDRCLVSTISGNIPTVKFVCEFDKVQNNFAGDPAWIHYKTNMVQVMRFCRQSPLYFNVTFLNGDTLDITDNAIPLAANPLVQIAAVFEVLPYIRDDEFSHHMVDTLV